MIIFNLFFMWLDISNYEVYYSWIIFIDKTRDKQNLVFYTILRHLVIECKLRLDSV